MPSLSDYENLSLVGLEIDSVSWQAPRLTANFGDGYGATALVGSSAGLHRWSLSSGCLMDADNYGNFIGGKPRFQYYLDFIQEHLTTKDVFEISFRGKRYHASFVNNNFDAEMLTYDLFSTEGVEIKQRRVEGIVYNADGSIFDITELPGIYSAHVAEDYPGNVGQRWPNYLYDISEVQPLTEDSGDVINVPDVQNGLSVVRFNSTTNDGFISGSIVSNFIYEAFIVMKMREATFSNDAGILTAGTVVPFLLGDSGETKFTNLGIGGSYQYRLNGTLYTESNQQAPMNEFGVVHLRITGGLTLGDMQVGKDRAATDRYAEMDIGELILIGSSIASAPLSSENAAKLTTFLMRKWGIS